MDHYITFAELGLLLAIFWAPAFLLAAYAQYKFVGPTHSRVLWLGSGLIAEIAIGFVVWVSPIHRLFPYLSLPGGLQIGEIPFQAGVISALLVTISIYILCRRKIRDEP